MEFTKFFTRSVPLGKCWGPTPLPQKRFSPQFQRIPSWILIKLSGVVGDNDERNDINFPRALSRSDGERREKRSQKMILSEFKATYVENFFRTRLTPQF